MAAASGAGLGRTGGSAAEARPGGEPGRSSRSRPRAGSRSSAVAAALLFVLVAVSPPALLGHLTVFALAIVIGYYVIGHVHHALHTPLMSVTNAISGIIVVGALLQIGHDDTADHRAGVLSRSCWPPSTSSVASR